MTTEKSDPIFPFNEAMETATLTHGTRGIMIGLYAMFQVLEQVRDELRTLNTSISDGRLAHLHVELDEKNYENYQRLRANEDSPAYGTGEPELEKLEVISDPRSPHLDRYRDPTRRKQVEEAHARQFIYERCTMVGPLGDSHITPAADIIKAYQEWLDPEPSIFLTPYNLIVRMISGFPGAVRYDRERKGFVGLILQSTGELS